MNIIPLKLFLIQSSQTQKFHKPNALIQCFQIKILALQTTSYRYKINLKTLKRMLIINIPQTKSVSIAFTALKTHTFCMMAIFSSIKIYNLIPNRVGCNTDMIMYFKLLRVLFALATIVDIFLLLYFYFSSKFQRSGFYVFYVFHWIISLICFIGGFKRLNDNSNCDLYRTLLYLVLSSQVIFQMNSLVAIAAEIYFAVKFLHFGSNLVWTVLSYTIIVKSFSHLEVTLVGFFHAFLSLSNILFLIGAKVMAQGLAHLRTWRLMALASVVTMMLCYMIVLLGSQHIHKGGSIQLFLQMYRNYGLVQMVSPLLLLASMRGETQDPWTLRVKVAENPGYGISKYLNLDFSDQI